MVCICLQEKVVTMGGAVGSVGCGWESWSVRVCRAFVGSGFVEGESEGGDGVVELVEGSVDGVFQDGVLREVRDVVVSLEGDRGGEIM